jgi:hypothetical protein
MSPTLHFLNLQCSPSAGQSPQVTHIQSVVGNAPILGCSVRGSEFGGKAPSRDARPWLTPVAPAHIHTHAQFCTAGVREESVQAFRLHNIGDTQCAANQQLRTLISRKVTQHGCLQGAK